MKWPVYVIIPAQNEEKSIGKVLGDIPREIVTEVIVVDNGSVDNTGKEVLKAGGTLLKEPKPGYGAACLKGLSYLTDKLEDQENVIVVFLDGDYSDYPEQMPNLLQPILEKDYEMVIGSRSLGKKAKNSMTPQQVFGNWLATLLMKFIYKAEFTDLGPFRAITYKALMSLNMQDTNFGWTVEMQLKAAKQNMKFCEVPVNYRERIGVSKVSGTLKGSILAGYKILYTIFKYV